MDESCISTCRRGYPDELSIPSFCTLCNENRPVLFINEEEISPVESDGILLALTLANLTNSILGTYNVMSMQWKIQGIALVVFATPQDLTGCT